MFTSIGPIQFSQQKNACYNSVWEDKEMNDHSLDFLCYFWLKVFIYLIFSISFFLLICRLEVPCTLKNRT